MKNIFVREATSSSRSSMISLLCREENTRPYRGICSHSIEKLKGSGSNVFWGGRGQVSGFSHQRKGGYVYHNGQQSQRSNSNCLIYTEPWCWLVDQGVPRTETERKPIQLPRDVGREPLARPDGTAWVGTEFLGADVVQGGRGGRGIVFRWFAGLWLPPRISGVGGGLAGPRGQGWGLRTGGDNAWALGESPPAYVGQLAS